MDDAFTWKEVADRLSAMPRGSIKRFADKLGLHSTDVSRRISREGRKAREGAPPNELSERHARLAREFFREAEGLPPLPGPAPEAATTRDRRLPVYGYAAGSDGDLIALNEGQVIDYVELPMGLLLGPGDYFVVRAIGSSMEPRIFPGEQLVVRRKFAPARGGDCIIEFSDGSGVVKTYKGMRDGRVFAEQYNPSKGVDYEAASVKAVHAVAFRL
jgi:phage repressor protein C with HTH and peptisase S24 domain